jgi:hypothetical protein
MATSGTSAFNPAFDDILQDAAGMVGGGPILAEELQSAMRGLDTLLTQIQNENILLHKVETTTVAVTVSTESVEFDNTILDALNISVRTNGTEMPMTRLGFQQWAELPVKTYTGKPTQYWFDRRRDGNILKLWPIPDQTYDIVLTVQKTTEDTIRAFQNVDVPRRFIPCLVYGIAYWVGMRRMGRVPAERLALLKLEFEQTLQGAMREDRERTSVFIRTSRR